MIQTSRPYAIRSLVSLLVLLLAAQPLITGCTVMNYGIGSVIDEEHAKRVPLDSVTELKEGDFIAIRFVNGDELEGKLIKLTPDYLDVEHYVFSKKVWVERDTLIAVEEVQQAWHKNPHNTARTIGTILGVVGDILLVVAISQFYRAYDALGQMN